MREDNPLVSIIVITYNSAKFVLETLESAKAQTYQNIELIVSDDCSSDNTVEICREWIEENKDRFVRTELITVEKNTGIAPNCNRGLYKAEGEWVKFIAGDDVLLEECISLFNSAAKNETNVKLFTSQKLINSKEVHNKILYHFSVLNSKEQYLMLLEGNFLSAPTFYFNRQLLIRYSGFDEKYKYFEDFPMLMKLLKNGNKIGYVDRFLVNYRVCENSVSNSVLLNKVYHEDVYNYFKNVYIKELVENRKYLILQHTVIELILLKFVMKDILNRKSSFYFILNLISFKSWMNRFKNIV